MARILIFRNEKIASGQIKESAESREEKSEGDLKKIGEFPRKAEEKKKEWKEKLKRNFGRFDKERMYQRSNSRVPPIVSVFYSNFCNMKGILV